MDKKVVSKEEQIDFFSTINNLAFVWLFLGFPFSLREFFFIFFLVRKQVELYESIFVKIIIIIAIK